MGYLPLVIHKHIPTVVSCWFVGLFSSSYYGVNIAKLPNNARRKTIFQLSLEEYLYFFFMEYWILFSTF